MRFGLAAKICLATFCPLLVFLFMAGSQIFTQEAHLRMTRLMERNTHLIEVTSQLIHELQKERGLSVGFINGSGALQDLEAQLQAVDGRLESFRLVQPEKALQIKEKLKTLRPEIQQKKIETANVFKAFSEVIAGGLALELESTNIDDIEGLALRLKSLYVLEVAKEQAGRLRATGNGILSANKALSQEQFLRVISLLGGVEQNLKSPTTNWLPETRTGIQSFEQSTEWQFVSQTVQAILQKSEVGQFGRDPKEFFSTITKSIEQLAKFVEGERKSISAEIAIVASNAQTKMNQMLALTVGLLLALAILLWVTIRGITRPIQRTIDSLGRSSSEVRIASDQLQTASTQMSSSASESASSLEETVAAMEELSRMVKNNSSHAQEAARLSIQGKQSAEKGEMEILKLVSAMSAISNSSKQVEDIITVIDDIAFQTNLLALNAAVEAARAGELGKGFAVVADAVRSLAQRSAEQAKRITGLIHQSSDQIKDGAKMATQSGEVLKEIVESIQQIATLNGEIATASREQSEGLSQIAMALNQLDQSTQSNAGSAEQSAEASEELSAQAESLNQQIQNLFMIIRGSSKKIIFR
jgi:methyl-accepting chemotaxis protein